MWITNAFQVLCFAFYLWKNRIRISIFSLRPTGCASLQIQERETVSSFQIIFLLDSSDIFVCFMMFYDVAPQLLAILLLMLVEDKLNCKHFSY